MVLTFLVVLGSCKKNSVTRPAPVSPDVYVAGTVTAANGKTVATFWKNGVAARLTDSTYNSDARSVVIQGTDVYITGSITSSTGDLIIPVYWKNGVLTKLNMGNLKAGGALGIALPGSDVYVIGYVFSDAGYLEGRCWKNGVLTTLPSALSWSEANAIKIIGSDIYIAGDTKYSANNYWVATYWKNEAAPTFIASTTGNKSSEIFGIDVNGADVYMAGYTNGNTLNGIPTYWKNGTAKQLTDGSSMAQATAIAVNGTDVVIAGSTNYNGHQETTYWKNDIAFRLGDGSSTSVGLSLALNNNDIYIAGYSSYAAVYWKNSTMIQLAKKGRAYGIAVVPHKE